MKEEGKNPFVEGVKERLKEFLKGKKLSDVAKTTGCHYTVVHNVANGKYTPSLETISQFKLGYGDEFDEVYILTGKRIDTNEKQVESTHTVAQNEEKILQDQVTSLQEKLNEREEQIRDLRQDKAFLQSLVKNQNSTTI